MPERQSQVLAIIPENRRTEAAKLTELLNVPQVIIRKDLDALEGKRLIRRQQGLAEFDSKDDAMNRLACHYKEKLAIVGAAVSQIKNGEIIMIESGFCRALLAEQIMKKLRDITTITNFVYIAEHTRPVLGNHAILLGEEIQMEPVVTVGPIMVQVISSFYVNKSHTGADGLMFNGHFTEGDIIRAGTVRAMSKQVRKAIILTEFEESTVHGVIVLFPCKEVCVLYTDDKIPAKVKIYFQQSEVNVYVVNTDSK